MAAARSEVVWAVVGPEEGRPYVWTVAYAERAAKTNFINRSRHTSGKHIDVDEEWKRHASWGFTVQQFDMIPRSM